MSYVRILSNSQMEIRCKGCGTIDVLDYVRSPNGAVVVKVEAAYTACWHGCCWLCEDCQSETHLLCMPGRTPTRLI